MDRASPPRERRDRFRDPFRDRGDSYIRNPYQPVPPPRASRREGFGTGARSYADAARGPDLDRDGHEVRRIPADTNLKLLIKELYAVIKAVHHLRNVAPGADCDGPRTIVKMVDTLATMIKPAVPTPNTRLLIEGAAREWGHTVCTILKQHYEDCLDASLRGLRDLLTGTWTEAFRVATRWARRNLPRITGDTIAAAEAMLTARAEETCDPMPTRVLGPPPQEMAVPSPVCITPPVASPRTRPPKSLPSPPPVASPRTRPPKSLPSPAPGPSSVSAPPRVVPRPTPRRVSPARDPLDLWRGARGSVSSAGEGPATCCRVTAPAVAPRHRGGLPPREQRGPRVSKWAIPYDSSEGGSSPLLLERLSQDEWEGSMTGPSLVLAAGEGEERERGRDEEGGRSIGGPSSALASLEARVQTYDKEESPETRALPGAFPTNCKVNVHPPTQRKMTDWNLTVTHKWLIVGDSNLAHLPSHNICDLQIDSFPEAHFRHAQALFEKSTPREGLRVEKIILSFGIFSRGNNPSETTLKYAQGALRSAKKKFPSAEILIQQVNFSEALPTEEKENLEAFNWLLGRYTYHIPPLPEARFFTAEDHIRWMAHTGVAFLDHWMAFLNA